MYKKSSRLKVNKLLYFIPLCPNPMCEMTRHVLITFSISEAFNSHLYAKWTFLAHLSTKCSW